MNEAVRLEEVSKTFHTQAGAGQALRPTSLTVRQGEILGLLGFSGAGKSTLLRTVNRLEEPTTGRVIVEGRDITALSGAALRQARASIGMIFQQFNLLAQRTALENVAFALDIAGVGGAERQRRAEQALATVGLAEKAAAYPAQLSGGQRQRVAIARALVNEPRVLLSDEATSALDPHSSLSILRFLKRLCRDRGMTILLVTHDINVAQYMCDRALVMEKGAVIETMEFHDPRPQSPLGRFFMETHKGWTDETLVPGEEAA
ncbi:ATP-binding cassette domain-containing protein [Leptolyngbya sp. 15MV]|nr:ATP-binding cassette domain-containing protein [Leptolyngbya sp. 15MV]